MVQRGVEKPTVFIEYAAGPGWQEPLREVRAGLEEEGIPCTVRPGQGREPVELAYRAAGASPLGVGVGIDGSGKVCLHHTRLPENSPLFLLPEGQGPAAWRLLGGNAARLVKGTPLRSGSQQGPRDEEGVGRRITAPAMVDAGTGPSLGAPDEFISLVAAVIGRILVEQGEMMDLGRGGE